MTDIKELQGAISSLPCAFAVDGGLTDDDFPVLASNDLCYESGFPLQYSVVGQDRKDIQRVDMNKFGILATSEAHFRQAGGVHTYTDNEESSGYSKGALLSYWDDYFLKLVESQYAQNTQNFLKGSGHPEYIDSLSLKTGDTTKKMWWKTVGYIYGIANSMLSYGGDFSSARSISVSSSGVGTIEEDALVYVGDYVYGQSKEAVSVFDTVSITDKLRNMISTLTITPSGASTNITISLQNKGRNGVYIVQQGIGLWWKVFPAQLCGNSNLGLCFFAKSGTQISCSISANEKTSPTVKMLSNIKYYPLNKQVKEFVDEE